MAPDPLISTQDPITDEAARPLAAQPPRDLKRAQCADVAPTIVNADPHTGPKSAPAASDGIVPGTNASVNAT